MADQDRSDRREELRRGLAAEAKPWPGMPVPELKARLAAKLREEELGQWNAQERLVRELTEELDQTDEGPAKAPAPGSADRDHTDARIASEPTKQLSSSRTSSKTLFPT